MSFTPAKTKTTFTSYVDGPKAVNGCESGSAEDVKAKLLEGEIEVARAYVQLFAPATKMTDDGGVPGVLVVTNYKLSFIPNESKEMYPAYQENMFVGKNDVTLSNIDYIYQITEKKKKRITSQQKISSKIEAIHIICKNFRFLKFSFKGTSKEQGRIIASSLLQFAFHTRHDLSFAYRYKDSYYRTMKSTVTMFNNKSDWSRELIRCGATEWKVVSTDQTVQKSKLLPAHFVIPKCVAIDEYLKKAESFYDSRIAFWVYSYDNASLVRMAELQPDQENMIENTTLESIRKCDPRKKSLEIINLGERLPSIHDVQRGYIKFRELCTPDTPRHFLLQDAKFYSLLEKSCWLLYVSLCLKCAKEAAESLRDGTTVVLRENNARDMCCVISSLVQIILDPYFRTIDGFQSLVQKEWVALEHPFAFRLGHVIIPEVENESPLLLLFLDCVWQLLQQYPEEFEFSQTYLTTIWDSAFIPIFDTFQFNSERERIQAATCKESKLVLRPIWDWNEQFSETDKLFFTNPFYTKKQDGCRRSVALPANAILLPGFPKKPMRFTMNPNELNQSSIPKDQYLNPRCGVADLEIWQQCYYRWIPILEIKNGGFPQIELFQRLLLRNISKLQRAIETGDYDELPDELTTPTNSPVKQQMMPATNSFFPFSTNVCDATQLTDILTHSNELLMEGSIMDRLSIAQLPD